MGTELLYRPIEVPELAEDTVFPVARIPDEFRGSQLDGVTYVIRGASFTVDGSQWLLDVGTIAPSGVYKEITASRPLTEGAGVHKWNISVSFPAGSLVAFRLRQQGFPNLLQAISIIPHLRIRGGRDGQT